MKKKAVKKKKDLIMWTCDISLYEMKYMKGYHEFTLYKTKKTAIEMKSCLNGTEIENCKPVKVKISLIE